MAPGIKCCCCLCCACLDINFLHSRHGLIKLVETVRKHLLLGALCQSLLVEFGIDEASTIGPAFHGFLTTVSACVLTSGILLACYVLSPKSQNLIRQSIFELLFNAVACFLYLSAATCLAASVHFYLWPKYATLRMYSAYPAMTAVYYIGGFIGLIHGVDAFLAFRYYKGIR